MYWLEKDSTKSANLRLKTHHVHVEGALRRSMNFSGVDGRRIVLPTGLDVGGKITIEWGGSEGVSVSGSASGKVSDDHGNRVEVEVSVDGDGSGSASVSVNHEESPES